MAHNKMPGSRADGTATKQVKNCKGSGGCKNCNCKHPSKKNDSKRES